MVQPGEADFSVATNTRGYYAFHLLVNLQFWLPIYAVFFLDRGLNYGQILIVYAMVNGFQTVLEIPSGMLADRWGRRPVMMLGAILQAAGFALVGSGNGPAFYFCGMALYGAALAMISGSDSAFIYDTLSAAGKSRDYVFIEGRAYMMNLLGWGAGGLIGGFIATCNLSLPFILAGAASLLGFVVMFTCKEPPRHRGRKSTLALFADAGRLIARSRALKAILIYSGLFYGILLVGHKFTQPYMLAAGIPLAWFGVIYFFWLMTAAISSAASERMALLVGRRTFFILLPLLGGAALLYLGLLQNPLGVLLIPLYQIAWGALRPQMSRVINLEAPSEIRATMLSGAGFASSLMYIIAAPVIGEIADKYDFPVAYLIIGILLITGVSIAALYLGSAIKAHPDIHRQHEGS